AVSRDALKKMGGVAESVKLFESGASEN
ncbi:hypothetical protein, partial [Frankia sp. CpI1-P]